MRTVAQRRFADAEYLCKSNEFLAHVKELKEWLK
jgi:hypothetical protein